MSDFRGLCKQRAQSLVIHSVYFVHCTLFPFYSTNSQMVHSLKILKGPCKSFSKTFLLHPSGNPRQCLSAALGSMVPQNERQKKLNTEDYLTLKQLGLSFHLPNLFRWLTLLIPTGCNCKVFIHGSFICYQAFTLGTFLYSLNSSIAVQHILVFMEVAAPWNQEAACKDNGCFPTHKFSYCTRWACLICVAVKMPLQNLINNLIFQFDYLIKYMKIQMICYGFNCKSY